MRRHLATIAAIGLSAMLGSGVWADDQNAIDSNDPNANENQFNDLSTDLQDTLPFPKLTPKSSLVDLGIDLTDVPLTPQGVNSFFATLEPAAQRQMLQSCSHFITTPNAAESKVTEQFCEVLLRS
jgi:hypothetical protein